ncbi:MAG TPA: AbrB family transcriptional regulator [Casimicrobiaceae bacterium]|nr:AbrB family transcriptional regulator [Casimicrobiaceae bacterium]
MTHRLHELLLPAGALVVALAAALLCAALRVPLPWMIGPMLAIAAVRVAGVHATAPRGARQAGQWIIGTALGLYFTPQVVARVGGIAWWLLAGAVFAIALGYLCGYLLVLLAGTDRTTAVFASVPGGAAEMAILGERYGARVDEVAAAQSLRILIVVVTIPSIYAALRLHGADPFPVASGDIHWWKLSALLLATGLAGFVLQRFNLPNAFVLGALAVAIPLTANELAGSAVPRWAINAAQLLLGCALGSRFNRSFLKRAPRFVASVVASIAAAMALSAMFAFGIARFTGLHPATLVLATAPGGIAEMAVTAQVLDLGVPVVTVFHVTRVILLLLCTGPLFGWLRRRRRGTGDPKRGPVA